MQEGNRFCTLERCSPGFGGWCLRAFGWTWSPEQSVLKVGANSSTVVRRCKVSFHIARSGSSLSVDRGWDNTEYQQVVEACNLTSRVCGGNSRGELRLLLRRSGILSLASLVPTRLSPCSFRPKILCCFPLSRTCCSSFL